MKCPRCQFHNPDGMQFCGQCGAKLESACPECRFINPPEFQFCGKCGARLVEDESAPSEAAVPKLEDMQKQLQDMDTGVIVIMES